MNTDTERAQAQYAARQARNAVARARTKAIADAKYESTMRKLARDLMPEVQSVIKQAEAIEESIIWDELDGLEETEDLTANAIDKADGLRRALHDIRERLEYYANTPHSETTQPQEG